MSHQATEGPGGVPEVPPPVRESETPVPQEIPDPPPPPPMEDPKPPTEPLRDPPAPGTPKGPISKAPKS